MKRATALSCVIVAVFSVVGFSQPVKARLHIEPTGDGFEVYIAAAMSKKNVPVILVEAAADAEYVMKATSIEVKKVGTGTKVVNCLFAYCGGNEDKANTSIQVVKNGEIVWSYSVNKGRGQKNRQSMAEAIAKHFKNDFLKIK